MLNKNLELHAKAWKSSFPDAQFEFSTNCVFLTEGRFESLVDAGVEIAEIKDNRVKHDLTFNTIDENYWQGKTWPKGHPAEGEPIVLRDYQVEVVNKFIENPQCLQEVATGAGKTIITATLSHLCEKLGRTVVIVPNKSLVTQTEEDYVNCGLDVGVYFGDRKELGKTHTICTWQSLNILDKKTKDGEAVLTLAEFLDLSLIHI